MSRKELLIRNASSTLAHYLKTAYESAGLIWTEDNDDEIQAAVEAIVTATVVGLSDSADD